MKNNMMEIKFSAITENESFARISIAGFCVNLAPTIDELEDIKTAVSEAVTNSIVHGYKYQAGVINIKCQIISNKIIISISDNGVGIVDIEQAKTPFFTTKPSEERSGMGFTVMESFMDSLEVKHNKNGGTLVIMEKNIKQTKLASVS